MKIFLIQAALALALSCSLPALVHSEIIYGDFAGDSVMYLDVTESNGTDEQKFGAPEILGDELNFTPTNFRAQSSGAAVIEDSQLNLTVMSTMADVPLSQILISEGGDYTLSGLGNAEAVATVGANVRFTVKQVDGNDATAGCVGEASSIHPQRER